MHKRIFCSGNALFLTGTFVVAYLLFFPGAALCQQEYPAVIGDAVGAVIDFTNNPNPAAATPLQDQIRAVTDFLSASETPLTEYQRWSLNYALGYLHYSLGIALHEGSGAVSAFSDADRAFGEVVTTYKPDYPNKKAAFARYMRGWCRLRRYLSGGGTSDIESAIENLQGITESTLESDIYFLRGFCYLLQASSSYGQLAVNEEARDAIRNAILDFNNIPAGSEFEASAHLYRAISHYIHVQLSRLSDLRSVDGGLRSNAPMEELEPVDIDNLLNEIETEAQQARNILTAHPDAGLAGAFLIDLANIQRASQTVRDWIESNKTDHAAMDQAQLAVDFLSALLTPNVDDGALGSVVQASASFVGNDPAAAPTDASGEAAFWSDLSQILSYMHQGPDAFFAGGSVDLLPSTIFKSNLQQHDARSTSLDRIREFFEGLSAVLNNGSAGRLEAVPFENQQKFVRSLELLSSFIAPADNITVTGTIVPKDETFQQNTPSVTAGVDELISAGRLAMILAGSHKNIPSSRVLYAAAYMIYLRASQGSNSHAIDLYRAISLFLAHRPTSRNEALADRVWNDVLVDTDIANWSDNNMRNEAHFYRARINQECLPVFKSVAENEYERITGSDPRACYYLGLQTPAIPKMPLLGQALCLTGNGDCFEWLRIDLFKLNAPSDASCGSVLIGPRDIRYDMLRPNMSECNIVREFVLDQLDLMLACWQALSSPPYKAYPWTVRSGRTNSLLALKEFAYLEETIKVPVVVYPAGVEAEIIVIAPPSTIIPQPDIDKNELNISTGQRNLILVSAPGYWPEIRDISYDKPGATLDVQLKRMHSRFTGERRIDKTDGDLFWRADGGELVIGHAGFLAELYDKGKTLLIQQDRQKWGAVSKLVQCAGNLFTIDPFEKNILIIDTESGDREASFNASGLGISNPTEIASNGEILFMADRESRRIVSYNASTNTRIAAATIEFSPTEIAVIGTGSSARLAALGGDDNMLYVSDGNLDKFNRAIGYDRAIGDGLQYPYRLCTVSALGYLAVTDLLSPRVYLFLPNGEYLFSIDVPESVSMPYYWIDIIPASDASEIHIATPLGLEILDYAATEGDTRTLILSSGYTTLADTAEVVVTSGGWFSDWGF